MNWDQIQGKWSQMKGSVKQKSGRPTNDDLDVIAGSTDKLIGKLQERYGIQKEEAQRQFEDWCRALASMGETSREHARASR
jgi:uncharacterized protein YjbJ (UPF0337 family)